MLRISVSHPLPPRPRRLTPDEVSRVFGGCTNLGGGCTKDDECCGSGWDITVNECSGGTCKEFQGPGWKNM